MTDVKVACILRYLVKGVKPERESQQALQNELEELLPHHNAVTIMPVVQGYSVEIEVSDLGSFSRESFEPYIAEHVLREAVDIRCRPSEDFQLQLLKAHFS